MKIIPTIFFLSLAHLAISQTATKNDSIAHLVCQFITENKHVEDTERIDKALETYVYSYMTPFDAETRGEVATNIELRLQRFCPEFSRMMERLVGNKGDWKEVTEKVASKLTKKECKQFLKHGKYSYLEASGDRTIVEFDSKNWTDYFVDGTTSHLNMIWSNSCSFQIEFIESNNKIRKNLSRKGDRYNYTIISKHEDHYLMMVDVPEVELYYLFKMYPE